MTAALKHIDVKTVKQAAAGRWPETISGVCGIERDHLNGKHGPCLKCGGKDRFRYFDDDSGGCICSQCHSEKNGDGVATVQWLLGCSFSEAVEKIADHLGLRNGNGNGKQHTGREVVEAYCRKKHVPLDGFFRYGGWAYESLVWIPAYSPYGDRCNELRVNPFKTGKAAKGLLTKDKPAGVFLPHNSNKNVRCPKPGERWVICEGPKDAAVLSSQGYLAVGIHSNKIGAKFGSMFQDCIVIVIPDRDDNGAGQEGATVTANRLRETARQVRMATLQFPKGAVGSDVRDLLSLEDGEQLLRRSIEEAPVWDPPDPSPEKRSHDSGQEEEIAVPTTSREPTRNWTDLGNAERFTDRHGDDVQYCHVWKKWLIWNGKRWKNDDMAVARQMAKLTVRSILAEAVGIQDDKERKAAIDFANGSENVARIEAMLKLAQAELGVPVAPDEFDGAPWLLNVQNGTIDLRTGKLREHRREDYITKICPVSFDSSAGCPTWLKFLSDVMQGNRELIGFLRRAVGMCLTGVVRDHALLILHGVGANGKSTFLNVLLDLLGGGYAMKAPTDLLMAKKQAHPTELADLHGKRLVATIEADQGRRLSEALVKELTGGDKIRARRMREDFWEFSATHKVWLAANHKPTVRGTDHGIWRRIKLIPFTRVFLDDEQDKKLPEKLAGEMSGILNWAVVGTLEWNDQGLNEPNEVLEATSQYRAAEDVVGEFLEECCTVDPQAVVKASALYAAYKRQCDDSGEFAQSQRKYGEAMIEKGFERFKSNGTWYRGIRLKDG